MESRTLLQKDGLQMDRPDENRRKAVHQVHLSSTFCSRVSAEEGFASPSSAARSLSTAALMSAAHASLSSLEQASKKWSTPGFEWSFSTSCWEGEDNCLQSRMEKKKGEPEAMNVLPGWRSHTFRVLNNSFSHSSREISTYSYFSCVFFPQKNPREFSFPTLFFVLSCHL